MRPVRRQSITRTSVAGLSSCRSGRVAALDTWVGYHPQLEDEILPQVDDLVREAERLLVY